MIVAILKACPRSVALLCEELAKRALLGVLVPGAEFLGRAVRGRRQEDRELGLKDAHDGSAVLAPVPGDAGDGATDVGEIMAGAAESLEVDPHAETLPHIWAAEPSLRMQLAVTQSVLSVLWDYTCEVVDECENDMTTVMLKRFNLYEALVKDALEPPK